MLKTVYRNMGSFLGGGGGARGILIFLWDQLPSNDPNTALTMILPKSVWNRSRHEGSLGEAQHAKEVNHLHSPNSQLRLQQISLAGNAVLPYGPFPVCSSALSVFLLKCVAVDGMLSTGCSWLLLEVGRALSLIFVS